jgi:ribosomal-protein-alanine N-acetyltransferase
MKTLETERLSLKTIKASDYEAFRDFEERNKNQVSPWRNTDLKTQMKYWEHEFEEGLSVRFLLFSKETNSSEIMGICNFTQIFHGPFEACYLGYHIDKDYEGKGLMSEAVKRGIQYMFEEVNLHRIMANYMPSNLKSANLLKKLGFTIEGYAKEYLYIQGKWEDHVITSLINPVWRAQI